MFTLFLATLATIGSVFKSRRVLVLENLALRQQLVVLKRSMKRPHVTRIDRVFWIVFARYVTSWRTMLHAFHPDTVVRWHRAGFRRYWTLKSRPLGRPPIAPELRRLIRKLQAENVGWGAPRIHGELVKLGYQIAEATVSKYLKPFRRPPSQTWLSIL